MLRYLGTIDGQRQSAAADVLVIGGGIAGLLLASQLQKTGVKAIVVESGSERVEQDPHPLNEVELDGQPYQGALKGRCRTLGGTSAVWGGAMLPFLACDFEHHTAGWPINWPVRLHDLEEHFCKIEKLFKLPEGPYDIGISAIPGAVDQPFILRSAKWPAFRLRNVARVLSGPIRSAGLEIWLDATVTNFQLAENGRIRAVTATSASGKQLQITAKEFVIAAGAIESTRLLLLLDAQHDHRVFAPHNVLGHYFYDHLSTTAATISPFNRTAINKAFGLRFCSRGMRDTRIEPSPVLRSCRQLPGAFAHVNVTPDSESGFVGLREIYRSVQSKSRIESSAFVKLTRDIGWLMQAAYWRFTRHRLLYPNSSALQLVAVIEQLPISTNRITLSARKRDSYGNPLAKISWHTSEADLMTFRTLQDSLYTWWKRTEFSRLGTLVMTPDAIWTHQLHLGSDVFHPGGTTRMGTGKKNGVVDANLCTFSVDNMHVVSTSTFPSGGGANPTFTLMAFALRAAEHLAGKLRRRI